MGLNLKHVPYIPLLIDFDKNQFLREVKQIPMYNYRTWHSCTTVSYTHLTLPTKA